MTESFIARSRLPASADAVFRFHASPSALPRLTPPFDPAEVIRTDGGIRDGDQTVIRIPILGPIGVRWTAEHRDYREGEQFVDVQVKGPFTRWEHLHRVEPDGDDASILTDRIEYRMPLGPLGALGAGFVRRKLERAFAWRHARLAHDVTLHRRAERPLRVAMSGASGLLGKNLRALLESGGHEVVPLVRRAGQDGIRWDPRGGTIDAEALEGFDAIVHLAGEPVAQRWTDAAKERIRASRWEGTKLLASTIERLDAPPSVFVSMSAVGFYGDRPEPLDERAEAGEGFLAEVCRGWEEASEVGREGVRVVNPRMGVALTPEGGALAKMLPAFRMGVGGRVGTGRQGFPWVSIDDAVGALYWMILDDTLEGPVNVTAPQPVDNAAFTAALGSVLRRPTVMPVPAALLKLVLGEMAEEALLGGARVLPRRLEEAGYPFAHRTLEAALRHLLGVEAVVDDRIVDQRTRPDSGPRPAAPLRA